VFGEGALGAPLMLVGEIPGDEEDLAGRPFVGPAGRLLDKALGAAGIDRKDAYITNVVKHFKWEPRGKRRLHKSPTPNEVSACLPWIEMEIELVKPQVLVCLGATSSRALLGRSFRVSQERGRFVPSALAPLVIATIHPSALLRLRDEISREAETLRFIGDLEVVRNALDSQRAAR
jgi:DNA polymerase